MRNKKLWMNAFGMAAMAIGASAATFGMTLAAFPNAKEACQVGAAADQILAGNIQESHKLVA